MFRSCGIAFVLICILTITAWVVSYYIQPGLPTFLNTGLVLLFLILLSVLGGLAAFKDTIELSSIFTKISAELSIKLDDFRERQHDSKLTKKGSIIVCVATFENRGGQPQSPSGYILNELYQFGFNHNVLVREIEDRVRTSLDAQRIGKSYHAKLVIWGWYDINGITTQITVIDHRIVDKPLKPEVQPFIHSDPDQFVVYVTKTLPATMTYLSFSLVGQIYYFSREYEKAINYEDILPGCLGDFLSYRFKDFYHDS